MLVFEVIKCAAKFKTLTVKTYFYLNATIKECTKIRNPNRHSIENRFLKVFFVSVLSSLRAESVNVRRSELPTHVILVWKLFLIR